MTTERPYLYACALHAGRTKRDAVRSAGYYGTDKHLDRTAARLDRDPLTLSTLADLRSQSAQRAILTRSKILDKLADIVEADASTVFEKLEAPDTDLEGKPIERDPNAPDVYTITLGSIKRSPIAHLVEKVRHLFGEKGDSISYEVPSKLSALKMIIEMEGFNAAKKFDVTAIEKPLSQLTDAELAAKAAESNLPAAIIKQIQALK